MLEKTRENEIHVEMIEEPPAKSIAFGLERLGLIPMKAPILSCIVLAILMVGAVFGIDRIKIDDSLSQLFRSNTKEFHQYEEVTKKFPAEEFDVLVVVEGRNLLARSNFEKIGDLLPPLHRASCRRPCSRPSCPKAPPTTSSSKPSNPTRSSAASCCRRTAHWPSSCS